MSGGAPGTSGLQAGTQNIGMHVQYGIYAPLFLAQSDIRIKKNIQPVTDSLQKLKDLNVVSYDHIDYRSPTMDAGVIAQNVINILPHAVNKNKGYIPNIYDRSTHEDLGDTVRIFVTCDNAITQDNSRVKLQIMHNDKEVEYNEVISNYTGSSFDIKKWENYSAEDKVFVYGTEVDDLMAVDKDQIGILAAAGVKELHALVQQQAATIASYESRLAALEAALLNKA